MRSGFEAIQLPIYQAGSGMVGERWKAGIQVADQVSNGAPALRSVFQSARPKGRGRSVAVALFQVLLQKEPLELCDFDDVENIVAQIHQTQATPLALGDHAVAAD